MTMTSTLEDDPHASRARVRLGTVLQDKWKLEALLGIGGMAAVYAATHRNGKRVAVKMLHAEFSHDEEVRTRFLQEGYAANTIQHDGAVSVLDDDLAPDGSAFIVMEMLEGETVEQRWERGGQRLPVADVLWIAEQLLDVLVAAHAKSVVHRDIKPENLFVTKGGAVKVLDFGIAKVFERQQTRQSTTRAGHGDGDAGVHGARAGPRPLGRSRRAHRHLGRRRDDVHADERPARARGAVEPGAAHPQRDGAGSVARDRRAGRPAAGRRHRGSRARVRPLGPMARRDRDAGGRARGARRARRDRAAPSRAAGRPRRRLARRRSAARRRRGRRSSTRRGSPRASRRGPRSARSDSSRRRSFARRSARRRSASRRRRRARRRRRSDSRPAAPSARRSSSGSRGRSGRGRRPWRTHARRCAARWCRSRGRRSPTGRSSAPRSTRRATRSPRSIARRRVRGARRGRPRGGARSLRPALAPHGASCCSASPPSLAPRPPRRPDRLARDARRRSAPAAASLRRSTRDADRRLDSRRARRWRPMRETRPSRTHGLHRASFAVASSMRPRSRSRATAIWNVSIPYGWVPFSMSDLSVGLFSGRRIASLTDCDATSTSAASATPLPSARGSSRCAMIPWRQLAIRKRFSLGVALHEREHPADGPDRVASCATSPGRGGRSRPP